MAESMKGLHRSHRCTEVSNSNIGQQITVMGWVQKRRNLGSLIFIDLRDRSGLLQIVFDEPKVGSEGFAKAESLRSEFVIAVTGTVEKRTAAVNENLKTGDIEVIAESIRILSESETPPFPIEENSQTKEDMRLRYRYLDLRRPDIQRNMMMKSKVAMLLRETGIRFVAAIAVHSFLPAHSWNRKRNLKADSFPKYILQQTFIDINHIIHIYKRQLQEQGGSVRGVNAKGQGAMPRKKIDKLVEFAKGYGAKGLAYLAVNEDGSYKSSFAKFMTEEELKALVEQMQGEPGDLLLFAADKNKIVWDVLGALRLELARELGLMDKNQYSFLWVTEFPLLEWSEEENRFMAMHHPFTMPMEEDWDKIDSDPGAVRAKAYDIVLNGTELGGGSVRIHQDDIQEKMLEVLGFTKERAHEQFGFLLNAFKYGVPPHAGLAYGLDRMVMLMMQCDSIRDVIAFPKVKDASCLMTDAPGAVEEKQLEELALSFTREEPIEE